MRTFTIALLVATACLLHLPAAAQDAESIRRELGQMREQFERTRRDYERALEALGERLRRLEAQPATPAVTTTPGTPQPPLVQTQPGPVPSGALTPMDILRPRQPFALYERQGSGQFLFDMGLSADFVGNITQRNVDKADSGSFPTRENRFFPREVELNQFGQIDPYARGVVRIEAEEDEPKGEAAVSLAEAYLTLLTLPYGT